MNFDLPELDPIGNLWFAVLTQAVEDVLTQSFEETAQRERDAARRWFRSQREDVGSFKWVCNAISLDHEVVLQRVRQQYKQRTGHAVRQGSLHGSDG